MVPTYDFETTPYLFFRNPGATQDRPPPAHERGPEVSALAPEQTVQGSGLLRGRVVGVRPRGELHDDDVQLDDVRGGG